MANAMATVATSHPVGNKRRAPDAVVDVGVLPMTEAVPVTDGAEVAVTAAAEESVEGPTAEIVAWIGAGVPLAMETVLNIPVEVMTSPEIKDCVVSVVVLSAGHPPIR